MTSLSPRKQWLVLVLIAAAMCGTWIHQINASPIYRDAIQSMLMGINLLHAGVVSMNAAPPLQPTMYREPVPALASAATVGIIEAILGPAESAEYVTGPRAQYVKYQNIAWLLLLSASVFVAARRLTGSFFLSVAAGVASVVPFSSSTSLIGVNGLFTELPAAALLALSSLVLIIAVRSRRAWLFVLCGFLFGTLALTKASFLYVVLLVSVLALPLYARNAQWKAHLGRLALLLVTFVLVIVPWMARNQQQFDYFSIAERGGFNLYLRALLNGMTPEEYRSSIYAWAPPLIQPVVGALTGYSPADLERGGAGQRLNESELSTFWPEDHAADLNADPEAALTYYNEVRAERRRLSKLFEAENHPYARLQADRTMERRAKDLIQTHWADHLALIPASIWRGAPLVLPFLGWMLVASLRWRRFELAVFITPAFAFLGFCAFATCFLPRFTAIAMPATAVAVAVLASLALQRLRDRPVSVPGSYLRGAAPSAMQSDRSS